MTEKVQLELPDELVDKADVVAKISKKSRKEILKEAIQNYIQELEDQDGFKEDVAELYVNEEISFETLKKVIGTQNAESLKASKALLEQGDELADLLQDNGLSNDLNRH